MSLKKIHQVHLLLIIDDCSVVFIIILKITERKNASFYAEFSVKSPHIYIIIT